jgi:hypothetical protein
MHPALGDPDTGKPYCVKAENESLRDHILAVRYTGDRECLFESADERPRPVPLREVAFETAWREFREGKVFEPEQ